MRTESRVVAVFVAMVSSLAIGSAFAHIKNEATQFPDIEFSEARFDIVVLVGAGIIPETPVFEPDEPLSRFDLATWAALADDLGEGGETPDVDALAAIALEHGLVESLDGDAVYQEINDLFFQGRLSVEEPGAVPTKGEAARFIASQLTTVAAEALLARRATQIGPTGEVARAETQANADGGNTYFITIGDTTLPMYAHGRVANGPIDLAQWEGRVVRRSFVRRLGDFTVWTYLEAEPETARDAATASAAEDLSPGVGADRDALYGLIAAALVLGLVLFFRRKRRV